MAHIDPQIVHLTINGETIETTPEHPFYVVVHDSWLPLAERGEWVAAGELRVGDAIRKVDGTSGVVSQVDVTADTQVMYNFTVESAHTYVVGDGQWVVHNTVCRLNIGDIHFTQAKYSTSGRIDDVRRYYVADNVRWLLENPGLDLPWGGEIEVFVKRPFMDKWGPMVYKDYVGDPMNLANDLIYTLDNRRLATYVLAERETVPVRWANIRRIREKSYEFDTRNFGVWIEPRNR